MKRTVLFLTLVAAACSPAATPTTSGPAASTAVAAAVRATPPRSGAPSAQAPLARKIPKLLELHGQRRTDDYFWLREKGSPEVLAYLEAEKAYAEAMMKPTAGLQATLYREMLGRIKETDLSVPVKRGDWMYYTRTEQGKQYPIYCRKPARTTEKASDAHETVILDLNEIAKTEKFVGIGPMAFSDDGSLVAYGLDTTGFRQFTLHVLDMRSGREARERIERVDSVAFAKDSRTLVYVVEDAVTKRAHRAFRHVLGEEVSKDPMIYEETDERFNLWLNRSRSKAFVLLTSGSKTTTEVRAIPAERPTTAPRVLVPRAQGHEYYVDHRGDRFYIRTNDRGRNFRLVSAPVTDARKDDWQELVAHRDDVMLEDVEVFADHYVTTERESALPRLHVTDFATKKTHAVSFPEQAYDVWVEQNPEFGSRALRFGYESFTTPPSVFDYDVASHARVLLKRTEVLGGFDPALHESARTYATAGDGTRIPISMLYRRGTQPREPHPLLLTAYGSYGSPLDVGFRSNTFSLIDRGVVFAQAHIRGGGDGGKRWHDEGRMLAKMNTFTDFIASAEFLVKQGWTAPDRLVIAGGSAGGLLMGAVANLRPDLWKAVVLSVPFVDVVNTMSDATLPLTVGEFEEWGDPKVKEHYDAMIAYSPYDNVTAKAYPAMLVESSYNDSQVMYWEPAKYVAKMRATRTDSNPLVFKINLDPAGHGGKSGRYERLEEKAYQYAFILAQLGLDPSVDDRLQPRR